MFIGHVDFPILKALFNDFFLNPFFLLGSVFSGSSYIFQTPAFVNHTQPRYLLPLRDSCFSFFMVYFGGQFFKI